MASVGTSVPQLDLGGVPEGEGAILGKLGQKALKALEVVM